MRESLRRIFAVFQVRNIEFYRDWGALVWSLVFPVLMMLAFGYLFRADESLRFKVGRIAEAKAPEVFEESFFEWVSYETLSSAEKRLHANKLDLVWNGKWNGGVVVYASESPRSLLALKVFETHEPKGVALVKRAVAGKPVSYAEWLFSGVLAMNVLWLSLWGVGWVIVRQRKYGILKRFKASPLYPHEYLIAQLFSRLWVLVASGIFVFLVSRWVYPFRVEGSVWSLLLIYTLGCLSMSSIGLIVAARVTSEELANGLLNFFTYPMMFLSEIWFSLEGSPEWVQKTAHALPLWQMTDAMRRIQLEGATLAECSSALWGMTPTA